MASSGKYITQSTGYKAFIPESLPEKLDLSKETLRLLAKAEQALDRLDTAGELLPNIDYILAMYVRKEALLSSQIEGTQASLDDLFDYEGQIPLKNGKEVEEVVNYIKAMKLGVRRLVPDHKNFPESLCPDFSVQQSAESDGNLHQVAEIERKAGREKMGQTLKNFCGRVLAGFEVEVGSLEHLLMVRIDNQIDSYKEFYQQIVIKGGLRPQYDQRFRGVALTH